MPPSDVQIEVLVVALLSVSSYSPDRAAQLLPALRRERLCDVEWVAASEIGPIVVALTRSGYHRGGVNGIIAPRMKSLMQAVLAGDLDELSRYVASGNENAVASMLRAISGVGPHVARTAWALLRAVSLSGGDAS